MESNETIVNRREPWNEGKLIGQKAPFKPKENWVIRMRLQMEHRIGELALFNLGIDSKLRGCDLTALRVREVFQHDHVATRAIMLQHKTQRPLLTGVVREERREFEVVEAERNLTQSEIWDASVLHRVLRWAGRPNVVRVGEASETPSASRQSRSTRRSPDQTASVRFLRTRAMLMAGDPRLCWVRRYRPKSHVDQEEPKQRRWKGCSRGLAHEGFALAPAFGG
jgi:hypothetical protein